MSPHFKSPLGWAARPLIRLAASQVKREKSRHFGSSFAQNMPQEKVEHMVGGSTALRKQVVTGHGTLTSKVEDGSNLCQNCPWLQVTCIPLGWSNHFAGTLIVNKQA